MPIDEHSFADVQAKIIRAVATWNEGETEKLAPRILALKRAGESLETVQEMIVQRRSPFDRDMPTADDLIEGAAVAAYNALSNDDRCTLVSEYLVDKFPARLSEAELRSATEAYIDEHSWGQIEAEALMAQITLATRLVSAPVSEVRQ